MKIYRSGLLVLAVILFALEVAFVRRYLPTVQEPIETFGAGVLFCGTFLLVVALWMPSTRFRFKWLFFGLSMALALWLLLMSYAFMMHW